MNTLSLSPATVLPDGRIKLSATLSYGFHSEKQYLIVQTKDKKPEQLTHSGDVWCIIFLHKMMEIGGQFHIKSTLSKSLWRGIDRYVKAWCQTNPGQYRDIELTADELVDDSDSTVKQKAISCFSGGLDACFTAYRHAKALAGPQSLPLKACLMLHGADIRKDDVDEWRAASADARSMVEDLGLDFYTIETNFRDMHCDYGMAYFSMLVGCMRVFEKEFGYLMLGNDGMFTSFLYPHGSNPVTNHFLSSAANEIVTDGAEFCRIQKAALVSKWEKGLAKLRVCWQGDNLSSNCGKCAKCKRTIINFKAAGIDALPCMPALTEEELFDFELTQVEQKEMLPVLEYLEHHPITPTPSWVQKLRDKLAAGIQESKPRKRGFFAKLFRRRKKQTPVNIVRPNN